MRNSVRYTHQLGRGTAYFVIKMALGNQHVLVALVNEIAPFPARQVAKHPEASVTIPKLTGVELGSETVVRFKVLQT
jgi:hypothetical protein